MVNFNNPTKINPPRMVTNSTFLGMHFYVSLSLYPQIIIIKESGSRFPHCKKSLEFRLCVVFASRDKQYSGSNTAEPYTSGTTFPGSSPRNQFFHSLSTTSSSAQKRSAKCRSSANVLSYCPAPTSSSTHSLHLQYRLLGNYSLIYYNYSFFSPSFFAIPCLKGLPLAHTLVLLPESYYSSSSSACYIPRNGFEIGTSEHRVIFRKSLDYRIDRRWEDQIRRRQRTRMPSRRHICRQSCPLLLLQRIRLRSMIRGYMRQFRQLLASLTVVVTQGFIQLGAKRAVVATQSFPIHWERSEQLQKRMNQKDELEG